MKKLTFILAVLFTFAVAACTDGTRQEDASDQNTELGSENLGEEEMETEERQQQESDTSFQEMEEQEQRPEL